MNRFVKRALAKIPKLDTEQIRHILEDVAAQNDAYQAALDSLNDGVIVCDDRHTISMTNRAAERYLVGPIPRQSGDKVIWDAVADEDIRSFVQNALENEETVVGREFALEWEGGVARILRVSVFPLIRDGYIQGSIIQIGDVSESRAREARLRRAENLASLTTLAAGVAHEIKNPLGSIGIHAQLVQRELDRFPDDDVQEIRESLAIVNEEIQRLNKIVVDFLFAVRPMDTYLVDCDVNEIVRELVRFIRVELEEQDIEVEVKLDDQVPLLKIDEKYFKQALLNVFKNAMPAMPDGGRLTVSTRATDDTVFLRVSDTGTGMSDEVLAKIFEPYFTTKDFGSGIGLTLVYKVIKEHMGDISVTSREGVGTTFTISLPVPQRETHLLSWTEGDE